MQTVWESEPKQETDRAAKWYTNMDNNTKSTAIMKSNKTTEYFLSGPTYESDRKKSAESAWHIYKDFDDVFNDIGCFEGTFWL